MNQSGLKFYGPVIFVKDISRAKKFYIEFLNQEVEHDFGANIIFKSHLSPWQMSPDHEIAKTRDHQDRKDHGPLLLLCYQLSH